LKNPISGRVLVTVVIASIFVAFALGLALVSTPSPIEPEPLEVSSLQTGSGHGPGGPQIILTLQSTASESITNLTTQILVYHLVVNVYEWLNMYIGSPANINATAPLVPGQVATFVIGLAGSFEVSCGMSYALTVSGVYANGPAFGFVTSEALSCPT